jgi:hypothetical protein
MAPPTGFEPVTKRLTVVYSTAELRGNIITFVKKLEDSISISVPVKYFLIKKCSVFEQVFNTESTNNLNNKNQYLKWKATMK